MRSSSIIIAEAKIFSVSPDPIGVESSLWIAGMVCVIAGIASRLIDRFTGVLANASKAAIPPVLPKLQVYRAP